MAAVEFDRDAREVRAVRPLRESGNSTVLSIPPNILQAVGLEPGDEVKIVGDMEAAEIRLSLEGGEDPPEEIPPSWGGRDDSQ